MIRIDDEVVDHGEAFGDELVRVWEPRDLESLQARVRDSPLAIWAENDVLHVLWKGVAEEVNLIGGVQTRLQLVQGTSDLWEVSLRIRRLDEAVISLTVSPSRLDDSAVVSVANEDVWRGPLAPAAAPSAGRLRGRIEEHDLQSAALGTPRRLTVYRPPGSGANLPGCMLADGQSVQSFARTLEPAILSGAVPPLVIVGIHDAFDPLAPWPDRRAQEYLPGEHRRRFDAHLRFAVDEVIPWANTVGAASSEPWIAAGFSNGGAWAVAAAQHRPETFTAVAAFSASQVPQRITSAARTAGVRHYLAAGILEPGFRNATREWANRLQRAGLEHHYEEWVGGHDHRWWTHHWPQALGWLLRK